ncbi:hypothetical protein BDZ91DRAFT_853131 [Kalaharituber pfeilii]|nr:hypothetical protein BDZ91DRAFT_853131 [Kalaharituber pfeilii]
MKSFSILLTFTLAAVSMLTPALSYPQADQSGLIYTDSEEVPEELCETAIEFDIPEVVEGLSKRGDPGPPTHFCCDGYTAINHAGKGQRTCCPISAPCCNIATGSAWSIPGYIKSLRPVEDASLHLKQAKNCGTGACLSCAMRPSVLGYPGWKSMRRNSCTVPSAK